MNAGKGDILKVTEAVNSPPFGRDDVWGGRPKAAQTKEQVTLRLSPDVSAAFRKDGKGWQTRINGALRQYWAMP